MKTNISLIINDDKKKLRKRTDSILPSILIVIVSAVYNNDSLYLFRALVTYLPTYLLPTYLKTFMFLMSSPTASLRLRSRFPKYLVTCNNLCKKILSKRQCYVPILSKYVDYFSGNIYLR